MTKHLKRIFLFILMTACSAAVFAQANKPVEMADVMRSNGKIYIVVAICLTILLGLFFYVWLIDRKIAKLEKE